MKRRLGLALGILLLGGIAASIGGAAAAHAQEFSRPPEVLPKEFALMAWGESPSNPQQLDWMRQAGFNISGFCSPDDLSEVHAAGLSCFVSDPLANQYDWTALPDEKTLRQNVADLVPKVAHSPAALGFFLRDEPGASLMPGLGKMVAILRHAMPRKWAYINLLPDYTPTSQLEAKNYEAYLKKFIHEVHPALLSYDNYSLFNGKMLDRFYTNLGIIRRVSLKAGIPFWNVILSNTHFTYMEPSGATLRLQAYSTIAYGGRGIEYFTYFAPRVGNYRLAPVDQFGHRTPTWDELRLLNSQIRELAPWLARLRSTGVYHSAPVPQGGQPLSASRLVKEVLASTYQSPPVAPRYLIGEFESPQSHPFLMIVNKDLNHSIRYLIHLKQRDKRLFQISPYTGKERALQGEMNWLAPGAGALFEIK